MKIKEFIIEKELRLTKERFKKLIEIGAPKIMMDNISEQIKEMENGEIKIGGDLELLDYEFNDYEVKKGRGGKVYIEFDNSINYFPNAKYGRYISRKKER